MHNDLVTGDPPPIRWHGMDNTDCVATFDKTTLILCDGEQVTRIYVLTQFIYRSQSTEKPSFVCMTINQPPSFHNGNKPSKAQIYTARKTSGTTWVNYNKALVNTLKYYHHGSVDVCECCLSEENCIPPCPQSGNVLNSGLNGSNSTAG